MRGQLLLKGPPVGDLSSRIITSVTQMCSGEGLNKKPSFWVRSERCAVATGCLAPAGDLLLEAVRSNQKTGAVQCR